MCSRKPFFSVIMPVYNAEKYIDNSIQSILNQTFGDFELIIIDDGSSDDSKKICAKYASNDSRIILKQTMNHLGVANVRNEGLKWVRGEYLTFVDADDWIDTNIFQYAYERIQKKFPDIVKYGCMEEYFDVHDRKVGEKKVIMPEIYISNQTKIRQMIIDLEQLPLFGYVCNGFYSMKLIKLHHLKFDVKLKVNEDFSFNLQYFNYVKTMDCLSLASYHYAKRISNSLSTKKNDDYYKFHMFKIEKILLAYKSWGLLDSQITKKIFWLYTRCVYSTICRKMQYYENYPEALHDVYHSSLYRKFQSIVFTNMSLKKNILIYMLQHKQNIRIYLLCFFINFIKKNFRILFAKIKG